MLCSTGESTMEMTAILVSQNGTLHYGLAELLRDLGYGLTNLPPSASRAEIAAYAPDVVILDCVSGRPEILSDTVELDTTTWPTVAIVQTPAPGDEELGIGALLEQPVNLPALRLALATARAHSADLGAAPTMSATYLRWLQSLPWAMAQSKVVDEVLVLATDHVQHGFGFERIGISLYDESACVIRHWLTTDSQGRRRIEDDYEVLEADAQLRWKSPEMKAIMLDGRDYYYSVVSDQLTVAIRMDSRVLGWIFVDNYLSRKPIRPDDAAALVRFGRELAVALDSALLRLSTQRRAQEFAALAEVSVALAAQRDPLSVCRMAVSQLAERFNYDEISIYMREGDELVCKAEWGFNNPYRLNMDAGVVARAVREGLPQFVPDSFADPDYVPVTSYRRAELCVPILIDDTAVGAIDVEVFAVGILDSHARDMLIQLARNVAVALHNAQLDAEAQQNLRSREWLQRITTELAQCASSSDIVSCAAEGLREGFGYRARVVTLEHYPPQIRVWNADRADRVGNGSVVSLEPDSPAWTWEPLRSVLLDGAEFVLLDPECDEAAARAVSPPEAGRLSLWLALRAGHVDGTDGARALLGMLCLDVEAGISKESQVFPLLVTLANHVATSLERAKLLEMERRRTRVAEALDRATSSLSFATDAHEMFTHVLACLQSVVRFDTASVIHFEGGKCRCDPVTEQYNTLEDCSRVWDVAADPVFREWLRDNRQEPELISDSRLDARWQEFGSISETFQEYARCYLAAPLVVDGNIVGALSVSSREPHSFDALSVTALGEFAERLERGLRNTHLYNMERSANSRLQAAMQLQDEFVATVSHELRTPLTSILGFSEILTTHWCKLGEDRRLENVEKIRRAGLRLDRLVRDLLYVSRVDSGTLKVSPGVLPVLPTLHQAIEELALKFRSQIVDVAEGLHAATVWADPDRLCQVLANLLENAAKYSPEGSPIAVSWGVDGDFGIISIHDRGPGIAPDKVNMLFRRFGKLDSAARAGQVGTGLGLYICKQLVEAMGGQVWYEPNPAALFDTGSMFSVRLPRGIPSNQSDLSRS